MDSQVDDASIEDDWFLLRRISPDQVVVDKDGAIVASSAAFRDPKMSVDVEELLARKDLDWNFTLKDFPQHSLVKFKTAEARKRAQIVVLVPVPHDAHAEVRGKKSRPVSRELRDASTWVHRR